MSIVGLLLISSYSQAATCSDAKRVFDKLSNETRLHPRFQCLRQDDVVNAYATLNAVMITTGMLKLIQYDDEIAVVLGHELSHYRHRDAKYGGKAYFELRSDKEGYNLCKRSGYRKCALLFIRMTAIFEDSYDEVHPRWSYRYKRVINSLA